MKFISDTNLTKISRKLAHMQLTLARTHSMELEQRSLGLDCYEDISKNILEIVNLIGGEKSMQVFAEAVIPFYMFDN